MLPGKHVRHIVIMTPSASSAAASSERHTFGFRSITFKGCINFIQSLQNGKSLLNTGQVLKRSFIKI